MKKLLIIPALAALALTGCGSGPAKDKYTPTPPAATPAPVPTKPASEVRMVTEVGSDNTLYEVTGKNSTGVPFRCYITETYQGVSQTCFEYKQT